MLMDYFRRPLLAGSNITRLTYATVRGNVRRSDADGFSIVPYFPLVSATQTLSVKIQATTYPVVLTGNSLTTVLADINTAIGVNGVATDADGTISIRTAMTGSAGSIEILSGTASAGLGFDVALTRLRSTGGDVLSTPEGRVGNSLGVAFPNKGENLTAESVNRAMARITANMDILHSDAARGDAKMRKISFTASGDGKFLTPAATERLFTGLGFLSNASAKEDLAHYFTIIDTATKQLAVSRVVAIVQGAPAGLPPYANVVAYNGTGNVLGQDLAKTTALTINAVGGITNGRVVSCSAANFTTSAVQAGDYAVITGATNLNPWNNNGYRWVVEEVLSATTLALRPMSKAELAHVGTVVTEEQPVIELNAKKTGGEIYGTLTVKTGTFCDKAVVVVDPPIQTGATYELWASTALDDRNTRVYDMREGMKGVFSGNVSDLPDQPDGIITRPTVAMSGLNVAIGAFYYRKSGKIINVPARTFLPADIIELGSQPPGVFIYLDLADYRLKANASNVIALGADPGGFYATNYGFDFDPQGLHNPLIATVYNTVGVLNNLRPEVRIYGGAEGRRITVGTDATSGFEGQFRTIEEALLYISASYQWGVSGDAEKVDEIVIYGYQQITRGIVASLPGHLRIRGATNNGNNTATLQIGAISEAAVFDLTTFTTVEFIDLRFDNFSTGKSLVRLNSQTNAVNFIDCTLSTNPFLNIVQTVTVVGSVCAMEFRGCSFSVTKSLVTVDANFFYTKQGTVVEDCSIVGSLTEADGQMFSPNTGSSYFPHNLTLNRCAISNFRTSTAGKACIAYGVRNLVATDCTFGWSAGGSPGTVGGTSSTFKWEGPALVRNCKSSSNALANEFFRNNNSTSLSIVEGCAWNMKLNGFAEIGCQAKTVRDNSFTCFDSDPTFGSGYLVQAENLTHNALSGTFSFLSAGTAVGNTISVSVTTNSSFFNGLTGNVAIGNDITLNAFAFSSTRALESTYLAHGNVLNVNATGTLSSQQCAAINSASSTAVISANRIFVTGAYAIRASTPGTLITGNSIGVSGGLSTSPLIRISGTGSFLVTNNRISGSGGSGPHAVLVELNSEVQFTDNDCTSLNSSSGPISGNGTVYVVGNNFASAVNMTARNPGSGLKLVRFSNNVVGGGTASSLTLNDGVKVAIEGNRVSSSPFTLALTTASDRADFNGNEILGALSVTGPGNLVANGNRVTLAFTTGTDTIVDVDGNYFDNVVAISNGSFSNNKVTGAFTTNIGGFFPLKVLVDGNTFNSTSSLVQSPGTGGTQIFNNNICIGVFSVSNASNFPGIMINGCMFATHTTLVNIDSFNNCKVGQSNPSSLITLSLSGTTRAIAVAGTVAQECAITFSNCSVSGGSYRTFNFPCTQSFTQCSIAGTRIDSFNTASVPLSFTSCRISSSYLATQLGALTLLNCDLSGSDVFVEGVGGGVFSGSKISSTEFLGFSDLVFTSCRMGGATVSITANPTFSDCHLSGSKIETLSLANNIVFTNCNASAIEVTANGGLFFTGTHTAGSEILPSGLLPVIDNSGFTSTLFWNSSLSVTTSQFSGCHFVSNLTLTVAAYIHITDSLFDGFVNFASVTAGTRAIFSGNTLVSNFTFGGGTNGTLVSEGCYFQGTMVVAGQNAYLTTLECLSTATFTTAGRLHLSNSQITGNVTIGPTVHVGIDNCYTASLNVTASDKCFIAKCYVSGILTSQGGGSNLFISDTIATTSASITNTVVRMTNFATVQTGTTVASNYLNCSNSTIGSAAATTMFVSNSQVVNLIPGGSGDVNSDLAYITNTAFTSISDAGGALYGAIHITGCRGKQIYINKNVVEVVIEGNTILGGVDSGGVAYVPIYIFGQSNSAAVGRKIRIVNNTLVSDNSANAGFAPFFIPLVRAVSTLPAIIFGSTQIFYNLEITGNTITIKDSPFNEAAPAADFIIACIDNNQGFGGGSFYQTVINSNIFEVSNDRAIPATAFFHRFKYLSLGYEEKLLLAGNEMYRTDFAVSFPVTVMSTQVVAAVIPGQGATAMVSPAGAGIALTIA